MIQEMARITAEKMSDYRVIESSTIHIYIYGLELLYATLVGIAVMIIISEVCKMRLFWVAYLAGFVPLRLLGGGYHAKTHLRCIFIFSTIYAIVVLIAKRYILPERVLLIACFVNLIIILFFSPIAAPNKPLREYQVAVNRRKSIIFGISNLVGCFVLVFLLNLHNQWINIYFAGSSMAGLSMLLAVAAKRKKMH